MRWDYLEDDTGEMTLDSINSNLTKHKAKDKEMQAGWTAQFDESETACSCW